MARWRRQDYPHPSNSRSNIPTAELESFARPEEKRHAAYARCGDRWCDFQTIRYKQSADGTTWTASETVDYSDLQAWVTGVGVAGKVMVLYMQPPDGSLGPFGTWAAVRTA